MLESFTDMSIVNQCRYIPSTPPICEYTEYTTINVPVIIPNVRDRTHNVGANGLRRRPTAEMVAPPIIAHRQPNLLITMEPKGPACVRKQKTNKQTKISKTINDNGGNLSITVVT